VSDLKRRIPACFKLYEEGDLGGLDLKELGLYLREKTSIPFSLCGNIYDEAPQGKIEAIAQELTKIKVRDPGKEFVLGSPLQAEIDYEKKRLRETKWRVIGILYEGIYYQKIIRNLLREATLDSRNCTILFTNQLFGTWDQDDLRYHVRVSLYGFPHLISISGLVEAPAKPKEFYLKKQMGVPVELLKEEYKGRFLDYGDARATEVLKGYGMQAFFYQLAGNPFCEDRDCRLFNGHWQEEVIYSQLNGKYEYCPEHEGILSTLRSKP
jgi:hypothetical protein